MKVTDGCLHLPLEQSPGIIGSQYAHLGAVWIRDLTLQTPR